MKTKTKNQNGHQVATGRANKKSPIRAEVDQALSQMNAAKFLSPAMMAKAAGLLLSMGPKLRRDVVQFISQNVQEYRDGQDYERLSAVRGKRLEREVRLHKASEVTQNGRS